MLESLAPTRAAASRGVNAVVFGLAIALLGQHNIFRLQPMAAAFCLADGLLLVIGMRKGRALDGSAWVMAGLSLAAAALIWFRPLYSILTYSFLLQLHVIAWLLGMGLLTLASARGGLARVGGAFLLGAALFLLTFEGAGMVERAGVAGLAIVVWGLAQVMLGRASRMAA